MPQQIQILPNTQPSDSQPAKFSPQTASSYNGDGITWFNADTQEHWPAPNAVDKAAWVKQVIKPGTPGNGSVSPAPFTTTASAATNANPAVLTVGTPAPTAGDKVNVSYSGSDANWKAAVKAVPPGSVITSVGGNQYTIAGLNGQGLAPFTGSITITMPYTLNYVCALHPAETGAINVQVNPQP